MLLNRSITTQFAIVFVLALLLVIGSFYLVLDSVYRNELKSQAETVADNVDAFGSWVSQYGRVWVRDDNKSYLGQVTLVSAPDAARVPPPTYGISTRRIRRSRSANSRRSSRSRRRRRSSV